MLEEKIGRGARATKPNFSASVILWHNNVPRCDHPHPSRLPRPEHTSRAVLEDLAKPTADMQKAYDVLENAATWPTCLENHELTHAWCESTRMGCSQIILV